MSKTRIVFFIFGLFVSQLALQAEVVKFSSAISFAPGAIKFDFQQFQADVDASDVFGKFGVGFEGENAVPRIKVIFAPIGGTEPDRVLENRATSGSSSGLPLVINFRRPVERVGFFAGNGNQTTHVTVTAFDPLGENLGAVTEDGLTNEKFIGLVTTSTRGIAKVVLDYGAADAAERIDNLTFNYVSRPWFNTYLAQVGDAKGFLQTIIVISNLSNSTAEGELKLFQSDSTPLSMQLGNETNSAFPFALPPFSSRTFPSSATSDPLKVGYATIESDLPVEATAIFRVFSGNTTIAEAGVGGAAARSFSVGVVQKVVGQALETGIAAVNTADTPVNGRLELYNEQGTLVAVNSSDLDLGPHQHKARYVGELFPQMKDKDFQGTLVISSDQPMAVVILRTLGGPPQSTLPVGGTSQ